MDWFGAHVEPTNGNNYISNFPVHLAVVVRQRKPYRRKDGTILYFEGMSIEIVDV